MKRLIWSLPIVLLCFGCAPTYRIVVRSDVEDRTVSALDSEIITQSWEQTRISARPAPASGMPSWIRRNFTVFEISLENLAGEERVVRLEQFALVDSNQVQRSPLPPEQLDRIADRYYYPPSRFVFGLGFSSGHYHHRRRRVGFGYHVYDGFPVYVAGDPALLRAFREGPVVPRSRKRGWLFFERIEEYPGNRLDLCYLVDGKIRMVFPFEVIRKP
ncbi:MAG TPA: hypothetical protein ENN74_00640 [Firmicutes bacterium]|nr:hypothetical protein [Bacillota bacterium]